MSYQLLQIKDLSVHFKMHDRTVQAVNNIHLTIDRGETLGLVGETGAGKTTTALSILRLIQSPPGEIISGEIEFNGRDLLSLEESEMRKVRGKQISMIFQDPMTALNPIFKVEDQIAEVIEIHEKLPKKAALAKARETLEMVGIPAERGSDYPHQFSGGMKQRVIIAIALACSPQLLIADEPTTALDVTIQAQVLNLMNDLTKKLNSSMLLITHDLGVVAETCDKVAIMYAGEIVESGTVEDIFDRVSHPYTKGLFNSLPSLDKDVERLHPIQGLMPDPANLPAGCKFHPRCPYADEKCAAQEPEVYEVNPGHMCRCHHWEKCAGHETRDEEEETAPAAQKSAVEEKREELLRVEHLKKYFKTPRGMLHAVDDISFTIEKGKTLGVVGESGCGKSTLGRTILGLTEATQGEVSFNGEDVTHVKRGRRKALQQEMQIIFQDPFSSLNPRYCVFELISDPLRTYKLCKTKEELRRRVFELMDTVGLARRYAYSYPHELDGGRRQRIGIARALSLNPEFIVCDEPVSALDVSIQAQVLNLLQDLQDEKKLTYIFVTHDLSVVKHISDDILVMYVGTMVEKSPAKRLFERPLHPYTQGLLSAIPVPSLHGKKERIIMQGELTSPVEPKPGCRFASRCPYAKDLCFREMPAYREVEKDHFVACHYCGEINGISGAGDDETV